MATEKDGGPAFPRYEPASADDRTFRWPIRNPDPEVREAGMSLRDYFAAHVLPAVLTAYEKANISPDAKGCIGTDHILRNVPVIAYKFADEMLKAREK
jgi:hypothetical protein